MSGPADLLSVVRASLAPHGIFLRGIVNLDSANGPLLRNGSPAASVVLLGNVGGSVWPAFSVWHVRHGAQTEPLDNWSKSVIAPVAEAVGATAYFPSDPPWQPFQQWAMRADDLKASPLGILIHPVYGLWHGYRGALGFADTMPQPEPSSVKHPCDICRDKPCLTQCPAGAVLPDRFDVKACRRHLAGDEGQAGCMQGGCLARAACPVGASYRYPDDQLRFHMAALSL